MDEETKITPWEVTSTDRDRLFEGDPGVRVPTDRRGNRAPF